MNQKIELNQSKKFPWGAAMIFAAVSLLVVVYSFATVGTELGIDSDMMPVAGIFGLISGLITAIIDASLQYVFTKFPTQWISKEKNVYKYDIWSAIFYTSAITLVLNLLIQQFNFQRSFITTTLFSVATTGLFLFFYFSGEEKKSNVKKAMTIVQIVLLVLSLIMSAAALMFVNNLGV